MAFRFRTIVAGSRWIDGRDAFAFLCRAIDELPWGISEVVSGGARGVDRMGEGYAHSRRWPIPVKRFPADWDRHGASAGFRRNLVMADYAQALLAIWDGESRGTAHMIKIAKEKGLQVVVKVYLGDGLDL
jgi:hypothetical protein